MTTAPPRAASADIDLARGELHPDDMPPGLLDLSFSELLRRGGYNYSEPGGSPALRATFVDRLARIAVRPEDTLVTHGALGALDLSFAALRPRRVRAFDPTYREALVIARAHNLPVAALPEPLDVSPAHLAPGDLIYLVPTLNNPDGRSLSVSEVDHLADVVARSGAILVEDDPYWLLADSLPRRSVAALAAAIEPTAPILRIQSFSKIICPGARCCVVEGTRSAMLPMRTAKHDFGTCPLAAEFVDRVLTDEPLFDHVRTTVSTSLRKRREAALAALSRWPTLPQGDGYFLWLTGDRQNSATLVDDLYRAFRLKVADGRPFLLDDTAPAHIRISVAWEPIDRILEGCENLVDHRFRRAEACGSV
ncbi:aminotransferase class I/II-fold pyridoxal phosphate-dependent enzyme [Nocardia gipuzkoensis]